MVICSGCGTENQEKSKFCQNCGTSLEIQSNIVQVKKQNAGESKAILLTREERFRKAKLLALKSVKEDKGTETRSVVFIGEKIL